MLADIFDNDGLILCELIDRGILDRLPPEDLAEVFSWFSFDRDFRYGNAFTLPDQLILVRRRLEDLEQAILGEERDNGLAISEGHNPTFYGAARAWCMGLTMADITHAIDLSEGDLVMTFNKTIDLMRQVRDMLTNVLPDHPLRETLARTEKLLRRGIVEQSLTIGFSPIDAPEPEIPETVTVTAEATEQPAAPKKRSRAKTPAAIDSSEGVEKLKRTRKKSITPPDA
jgi:ATP-dependent RNA helicase HelY